MPKAPDEGVQTTSKLGRIGGSFAPPITQDVLADYRALAEKTEGPVQEAMIKLCDMVEIFYQTPTSAMPAFPDRTGVALMIPLEAGEVARMFDHVPWEHELEIFGKLFDTLNPSTQKDERNAAFHLLWYGWELFRDREPMTSDKLRLPK